MNHIPCSHTLYELIKQFCVSQNLKLHVSDCSMCKYPVGWVWINDQLYYDSGCNCLKEPIAEKRETKDLIDFIQTHPYAVRKIMPRLQLMIQ